MAVRAKAARAGVYDYLGAEVDPKGEHPKGEHFAADAIVKVYRPAEEVFDHASVGSFFAKPITDNHPREAVTAENWRSHARGAVIPFGRGGAQEAVCIKLDLVNGWLFTIDSSRIKDDAVRERVILYQRECYSVLHDHFAGKRKGVPEVEGDPDKSPTSTERLRLVTEARQTFSQMAAREMWFRQGLPIVPSMINPSQNDLFHYGMINHGDQEAA